MNDLKDDDFVMVGNHIKYLKYPIPAKVPGELYFVGKDGYIYSVTMQRGGGKKRTERIIDKENIVQESKGAV